MADEVMNEQLVLISGESGSGKSASLRNIPNQESWIYANCEAGKRLPFANKFKTAKIVDPYQVYEAFDYAAAQATINGVIVDTVTFLMEMYESVYIATAADTQKAWGNYFQFFKGMMQDKVASLSKPVIVLGHTLSTLDQKAMEMRVQVPVKGALKNNGIEAYFSTVVSTKKVPIIELEKYGSSLLTITEEDRDLGFKHVFQTRLTKSTVGERIRSPMGLFTKEQTYMDNDAQLLLDHLNRYYGK
jgi:hypothetical protein